MTDTPDIDTQTLAKIAGLIQRRLAEVPAAVAARADTAAMPWITPGAQHLARLAHELKTPLSAIVAAAEIMRDARFGPLGDIRYEGYAAGIHESASHALGVINAMLGATPETANGHAALAFTEIDLNQLAEGISLSVRALMEAAGLSVGHTLEPGLPHVVADAVTVRQMLLNLVTNAMRATPAGGAITIETAYELAGPVHLMVRDTGAGMSQEDIARALDPVRPADFEPRPSGGLGIGYPLILGLARLNGASVGIESEPGEGTAVTITFAAGRVIPV
jgi:two-component system, cell cycle sensor histidine kinase PleC